MNQAKLALLVDYAKQAPANPFAAIKGVMAGLSKALGAKHAVCFRLTSNNELQSIAQWNTPDDFPPQSSMDEALTKAVRHADQPLLVDDAELTRLVCQLQHEGQTYGAIILYFDTSPTLSQADLLLAALAAVLISQVEHSRASETERLSTTASALGHEINNLGFLIHGKAALLEDVPEANQLANEIKLLGMRVSSLAKQFSSSSTQ